MTNKIRYRPIVSGIFKGMTRQELTAEQLERRKSEIKKDKRDKKLKRERDFIQSFILNTYVCDTCGSLTQERTHLTNNNYDDDFDYWLKVEHAFFTEYLASRY